MGIFRRLFTNERPPTPAPTPPLQRDGPIPDGLRYQLPEERSLDIDIQRSAEQITQELIGAIVKQIMAAGGNVTERQVSAALQEKKEVIARFIYPSAQESNSLAETIANVSKFDGIIHDIIFTKQTFDPEAIIDEVLIQTLIDFILQDVNTHGPRQGDVQETVSNLIIQGIDQAIESRQRE